MKAINKVLLITAIIVGALLPLACQKEAEAPYSDFEYTIDGVTTSQAYLPCVVQFENKSANATSYTWDFGDGCVSNEVSPSHAYIDSGTYNVVLKAFADGKESIKERQIRMKYRINKIQVGSVHVSKAKAASGGKYYVTVAGITSGVQDAAIRTFYFENCVYSCSAATVILYKCSGNSPNPQTDSKVYSVDFKPFSYDTQGSQSQTLSIKWGSDVQFEATVYYSCIYQR